ncbi:hypothetical protein KC901_01355 [Patescibacteria group bacterium]|nr:hypothetical protein [Patescibacteria group bacterium]
MIFFIPLLFIMAGFIIGLGAVTVIDIHGFLGRHSSYWTEATTRTHKVTKPLIWIGMLLFTLGFLLVYRGDLLVVQSIIALVMIMNGLFLSFKVSPFLLKREREGRSQELLPTRLQNQIVVSFILSFISWWGSVVIFVLFLMH